MKFLRAFGLCALIAFGQTALGQVKSVHVFVALADNDHQSIVPVPKALGDGDDPAGNLYWGAKYGVKTYFRASTNWRLLNASANPAPMILERLIFRHKSGKVVLVADAYKGSEIKRAIADFLSAAGGGHAATLEVEGGKVPIHGGADLVVYAGHNGLMDFKADLKDIEKGNKGREAIILCCKSKPYFDPLLTQLNAKGLVLTTGLMAPEAYTLDAALEGWVREETADQLRRRAAAAYDRYQKCGLAAAQKLFEAGN